MPFTIKVHESRFDPSQYDYFKVHYIIDGEPYFKNTSGIVDARGTLEMALRHGATTATLYGIKDTTETEIPLKDIGIEKKSEFYMDGDDSEDYYYCHRCGRVTPSYELDAHGGFCSDCDARWTAEHENESKDTDEKLGYEKGHKNSKGEDAPWVIRSHEDNRVLASFPTKKQAEDQMQRMKQYSKSESKKSESATTEEDAIRKAFKSIVEHVPENEKSNFGEEFVNENMEALLDLFNGWFEFDDGEFVTTVHIVDPDNEHGDCYDDEDEAYQWNACYNVTEGIIDLLGWNYGEETVKQPIQDALFYDFIGTKYVDGPYKPKESKKSEANEDDETAYDNYWTLIDGLKALGFEPSSNVRNGMIYPYRTRFTATKDGIKYYFSLNEDRTGEYLESIEVFGGSMYRGDIQDEHPVRFKSVGEVLDALKKVGDDPKKSEAHDLKNYTSDIISELDVIWACGTNGAKRLADKYADVIQQNYTDGDLSAAETAKFIAGQENLTESRKKTESKQSEVHLELIDTIIVPKWLWEAHTFGNEYGEDLDEHEQEILAKFEEEYGKQYYLDDRSEEADFRSRNDFDEYGGPCYEVDVYKMS